ncbi:TetR/AcrR family transcriptional regulator [Paenibacillus camerounensis]|uniref:TetR/AcrR family transcriptional regulator n=1 Tax=Paenibacillus camerounensis TaxID=1243663 RepID=UPI0005A95A66|nr:TetR/AcrR family transcriptional regulator [Paenibacillus camerounensis]
MTLNLIKLASRNQFAMNGYEGASLATIANEVGIKKQSIYTYFKGKDELFSEVFEDSWNTEEDFINKYFHGGSDLEIERLLHGFLLEYIERYEKDDNTNFFLRTIFYPPLHLKDTISQRGNEFIEQLQERIRSLFEEANTKNTFMFQTDVDHAAIAYIALMDGMFVEMLFGGLQRARIRLDASWNIYWRGIK